MAAKKIKTILKLNLKAGQANPAPPVGPALGQHGVNIMQFCQQYNEQTKNKMGQVIPAEITIYEDRSFTFITKLPPVVELLRKIIKKDKGAKETGREIIASLSSKQLEAIAKEKLPDMNTKDLEAAKRIIAGTARSMGIKVSN